MRGGGQCVQQVDGCRHCRPDCVTAWGRVVRDTRVEQAHPTAGFSTSVSGGLVFEPQRVLERRAAWLLVRYEGQAAA